MSFLLSTLVLVGLNVANPASKLSELQINEIYFAPLESNLEFIEVMNQSQDTINLCEFTFSDSRNLQHPVCEGNIAILPFELATLARDGQALVAAFPGVTPITPTDWPALNNSGDTVQIYLDGRLIDSVSYLGSWGRRGVSIERKDPAGPSNLSFNWGPCQAAEGATPGKTNSIFAPDQKAPKLVLAEVQEPNQIFLAWDEFIDTENLKPSNFRLSQNEPDTITLLTDSTLMLSFSAGIRGNQLLTRNIMDLSSNLSETESIALSYVPKKNDMVITEIMYDPLSDAFDQINNQPEYLELYNTSGTHLSLRSLTISGPKDEMNNANMVFPQSAYTILPPLSYAVIFASPTEASPTETLLNAFPSLNIHLPWVSLLPVSRFSLSLSNAGDYICVSSSSMECLAEITYSPSWHHPVLAATKGIALERRSLSVALPQNTNWSSSVAKEGGTPGWQNSIHIPPTRATENKIVQFSPSVFSPDGDGIDDVLTININSPYSPASIHIRIFDTKGRQVRTIIPQDLIGVEKTYIWDGFDEDGNSLSTGIYIFLIEILDITHGSVQTIKSVAVLAKPLK